MLQRTAEDIQKIKILTGTDKEIMKINSDTYKEELNRQGNETERGNSKLSCAAPLDN